MKDPAKKKIAKKPIEETPDCSLDIDVTPADLIDGGRRKLWLRDILDEVDRQWPQGRDPSGNGHGSRIGTLYCYFDTADVLHMHFAERGAYVERKGALAKIPVGHLPGYHVVPVANTDSPANKAADLLVALPSTVEPNDERWTQIIEVLQSMHEQPQETTRSKPWP